MKKQEIIRINRLAGLINENAEQKLKETYVEEEASDLDAPLPNMVEKFLEKLIIQLKGYNLNRKKQVAVIAKVIDGLGMDKMEVMRAIQKIKQSGALAEKKNKLSEASDDYADKFQNHISKKYDGKMIDGWKLDVDQFGGGFSFTKKGLNVAIFATPFWEGSDSIQLDVQNLETDDYKSLKAVPFKATGDLKKDEMAYMSALKKILAKGASIKESNINEDDDTDIKPGFKFFEIYDGYTMSGRGTISDIWQVTKELGDDKFECKLAYTSGMGSVGHKKTFTKSQILNLTKPKRY